MLGDDEFLVSDPKMMLESKLAAEYVKTTNSAVTVRAIMRE